MLHSQHMKHHHQYQQDIMNYTQNKRDTMIYVQITLKKIMSGWKKNEIRKAISRVKLEYEE